MIQNNDGQHMEIAEPVREVETPPSVVVSESVEKVGDAILRVQTQVARPFGNVRDVIRGDRLWRLAAVLVICIACYLICDWAWRIVQGYSDLLILFFVGWLVSFVLRPIAHQFVRWNIPAPFAIALSYVIPIAAFTGFIILIIPGFIDQSTDLTNRTTILVNQWADWIIGMEPTLASLGIKNVDLNNITNTLVQQVQNSSGDILKSAVGVVQGLASGLFQTILVIIVSLSLLGGEVTRFERRRRLPAGAPEETRFGWLPESYRGYAQALLSAFERNFGVFLEGQLLVSVLYGLATAILLTVIQINYATTTAVLAALIMIVPLFGAPASLLPPLLACLLTPDKGIGIALIIMVVLYIYQTLLLNIVLPRLIGKTSGVGPVATLFVLLAGAKVAGLWGVLFGVPLAGVVKALIDHLARASAEAAPDVETARTTVTTSFPRATQTVANARRAVTTRLRRR